MNDKLSDNLEKLIFILFNQPSDSREIYLLVKDILSEIINSNNKKELITEVGQKMGIQFFNVDESKVQEDLYNIIYDMSTLMVDSIDDKNLSNNFGSLPEQLLNKLSKLENIFL